MPDKTVTVVTGASRGIGREIAKALAAAGALVAILARNADAIAGVVSEIAALGGRAEGFAVDLSDRVEVERAFSAVSTALGPVDTLINNAGAFCSIGPIWEVDPEEWWSDIEINLKSAFYCSRAVLPSMLLRRHGRIVNVIGGGTSRPLPYGSAYSISKTGTLRLTECLAATLEGTGVICLAMDPGLVATDLTRFQMDSASGSKYLPGVAQRLRNGEHVPPAFAAQLAVEIASGRFDRLAGRAIGATEDLDAVEAAIGDILVSDERILRVIGFTPPARPVGQTSTRFDSVPSQPPNGPAE